jgi:hypothetical protein
MSSIAEQLRKAAMSGKRIVIREKTGKKYADYCKSIQQNAHAESASQTDTGENQPTPPGQKVLPAGT